MKVMAGECTLCGEPTGGINFLWCKSCTAEVLDQVHKCPYCDGGCRFRSDGQVCCPVCEGEKTVDVGDVWVCDFVECSRCRGTGFVLHDK